MTISEPKYKLKDKCWEVFWSPLPLGVESSTGTYPERVTFPEYCNAYGFYLSIKEAAKRKTNE